MDRDTQIELMKAAEDRANAGRSISRSRMADQRVARRRAQPYVASRTQMEAAMIQLDVKKLLGFRIGDGKHGAKIGQKSGSKPGAPSAT